MKSSQKRNMKTFEKIDQPKAKCKVQSDASFREARKTGAGTNTAGQVEDEDMQNISADRSISGSPDRVTKMFQNTPAFCGISGAADLFQAPAENNEILIASTVSAEVPMNLKVLFFI